MILDQYGKPISLQTIKNLSTGVQIYNEVNERESLDISRALTPMIVDRIMMNANSGDCEEQSRLARELPEKNHDIAHAIRTRKNAINGCKYVIEASDETPFAKEIAKKLEYELSQTGLNIPEIGKLSSFDKLIKDLSDCLITGFSVSEIVWKDGGIGFYGFKVIDQRFITFNNSLTPRLRVKNHLWDGVELPANKIIFHESCENGNEIYRGGLIRPLAWLHCFSNINFKDLLGFVERYGMPFLVGKVDSSTFEKEGKLLNELIRNFGPRGGGIISKNTEIEMVSASNSTGDVYFKLLSYVGDAITKVILGQLASSSDSSGLSGGDAQSEVRKDILNADARAIEDTINRDLFAVWTKFNYGENVASPRLKIITEDSEDIVQLSNVVKTLFDAGFTADEQELSERFGIKLRKIGATPSTVELSDKSDLSDMSDSSEKNLSEAFDDFFAPIDTAFIKLGDSLENDDFIDNLNAINDIDLDDNKLANLMNDDMQKAYATAKKGS